ncbi:site-specific integrase [Undibacterium seohonense]|uniref:Site-specific integrase n=1 Tax=Undibacterium seohonense TaxID=1344950 RepID=A0ABR6X2J3_9BURK|nr:site-specific integrase [Undibacterium seohonense]MBC3807027.1 site-specific integrase [Undibacterium seohonense]
MTSFRPIEEQAKSAVIKRTRHHVSRSQEMHFLGRKFIRSLGTENKYKSCILTFLKWVSSSGFNTSRITINVAQLFLLQGATKWSQKTLDGYRQAICLVFDLRLDFVVSEKPTILLPRAYRDQQIQFLIESCSIRLSLAIEIAAFAGLRAVELDTISAVTESREDKRSWLSERFEGMNDGVPYIVIGKGGLKRTVFLSVALSNRLEVLAFEKPIQKTSRKIHYLKRYDLIGGQIFSQQFSRLSKKKFGWSTGAHGLRHTYAQRRLNHLQSNGFLWKDAVEIVSQEMGHFSISNTLTYFR